MLSNVSAAMSRVRAKSSRESLPNLNPSTPYESARTSPLRLGSFAKTPMIGSAVASWSAFVRPAS